MLGTFNSGCAKIEVPILNRAGPLGNGEPGEHEPGPDQEVGRGEPNKYYPTGTRNYARVVATDDIQGPADALWSQAHRRQEGLRPERQADLRLRRRDDVSRTRPRRSSASTVVGFQGWDAKASSYEALATSIKASGAQAVFLGGIACNNGAKLMQDIKSVDPKIQLQMPDGFS